ncbi:MAG: hypothetical protein EXS37_14325 [Opitutus sp.]|nr:hypothetical protein [Opitutus sp.]
MSLNRSKYSVKLNFNYTGSPRATLITGTGVPPASYVRRDPQLYIDTEAEYRLHQRLTFFVAARNAGDVIITTKRFAPTTPDYARLYVMSQYGRLDKRQKLCVERSHSRPHFRRDWQ